MSSLDEIFQSLPIGQIAQQVGANESDVQQAAAAVLPALLGGLQANAQDPAGAASIEQALQQHDPSLVDGGIDVSQINTQDGEAIASHIFGQNQGEVVNRLGGLGGSGISSPLIQKLIPILAPIVMAYLAKQVLGGTTTGQQQSAGGGVLGSILGQVLGGGQHPSAPAQAPQVDPQPQVQAQAPTQSVSSGNAGIDDLINGALGGDQQAGTPQAPAQGGVGSILGSVLGGLLGGGRR